jgi:hypothetical protein
MASGERGCGLRIGQSRVPGCRLRIGQLRVKELRLRVGQSRVPGCGLRMGQLQVKELRLRVGCRVGVGELRVKWPAGDRTPAAIPLQDE